jgi:hypothetical protein
MNKEQRKIKGNYEKCSVWLKEEFEKEFKNKNWERRQVDEDFLKKLGISAPENTVEITVSGTYNTQNAPVDKEIRGIDAHRNDPKEEKKLKAYHWPFYKKGDEIIMPTKHRKRPTEERLSNDLEEFDEMHNETKNFNPEIE